MGNLVKIESKELDNIVNNSGLAIQEGEEIKKSYIPFILQLAEIQEQAKKIDFNNPQSVDETIARELRLKTVKIRTGASDLKDERKRIFLLKGNLEQAAYNVIAASCKLTEETFVQVEKAREIAEKKRKEERKIQRMEILTKLEYDFTFTDLLNMPDEQFDKLVLQIEKEIEIRKEAERIAAEKEAERIRLEKEENERIRIENEKLKAEREAKEKLEREIQAKKDAELKAKKDAEIAAAKAAKAPDKEKLSKWIDSIEIPEINLMTKEAKEISSEIFSKFLGFKSWAKTQINLL